ncbi:MAG: hypothetical protein J6Z34_00335 [Clostridia bacterium]|nr:hypothetical protein [Clostridia bacterium]
MKKYPAFIMLAAAAAVLYFSKPLLKEKGNVYYYTAASSVSGRVAESEYAESFSGRINFLSVKGESAFNAGECNVNAVLGKYRARPVRVVTTGGVTDYYCYSTLLGGGITLFGRTVNFHLSVADYGYSVATPLNFGGY